VQLDGGSGALELTPIELRERLVPRYTKTTRNLIGTSEKLALGQPLHGINLLQAIPRESNHSLDQSSHRSKERSAQV